MELTDGTIVLRTPVEDDAEVVAAAVRSSLAELAPWMPWASDEYDSSETLRWIRGEIDPTAVPFVITDLDGACLGSTGLNKFDELNGSANLGYWVATDATGRGVATRVTKLLARHGLDDLELNRIEVRMSVDNVPSRRVAERAGATFEGRLRRALLLHGRPHDALLYSFVPGDL